jgi:heme/copper-type cytochrome/quinol oxidase subunit 2
MESAKSKPVSLKGLAVIILILSAGVIGALGIYFGTQVHSATPISTQTAASISPQTGPFRLTLVEIMDTAWNSSLAQPQFAVLGPNGTQSSAQIFLPAHTLIQLTIVSYDTPTAGSTDMEGKVTGTVGGTVYLVNGTTAMGMNVSQRYGQNVTSVPGAMLAHTFSIPALGINIPVVGGDLEIAYLRIDQTGTFQWLCLTPCGFGPTGVQGAMSTPGWMEGQVTVY